MTWVESLNQTALKAGDLVFSKSTQAVQDIPAQHRLFNVAFMGLGWLAGNWMREIIFAQKSDGTEIAKEDVPKPLQFLHGIVPLNQYADDSKNQWNKIAYQMMPAALSAVGAYFGSEYAFQRNGREQAYAKLQKQDKLNILEADNAVSSAIGKPLRALAGSLAIFSSASGLTPLYGIFLSFAFLSSSNRSIFPTFTKGAFGPAVSAARHADESGKFAAHAAKHGGDITTMSEKWAEGVAKDVFKPLFPGKSEQEIREHLQQIMQEAYQKSAGKSPKEIDAAVKEEIGELFKATNFHDTLKTKFGFSTEDIKSANVGNAIPWLKRPVEGIENLAEMAFGHRGKIKTLQDKFSRGVS